LVFACPSIGPCASSVPPEPYPSAPPEGCTDGRRRCGGVVVGIWAPRTRRTRPLGVVPAPGPAGSDGTPAAGPVGRDGEPAPGPGGPDGTSPGPPAPLAAGRRRASGGRPGSPGARVVPGAGGGGGAGAGGGRARRGPWPGGPAPAAGGCVLARLAGLPVTWRMLASTWVSRAAGRVTPGSVPRGDRLTRPLAVRAGGAGSASGAGGPPAGPPRAEGGGTCASRGPHGDGAGDRSPSAGAGRGGGQADVDPLAAAA